jgi:nucleotide-binding universal stress UspA family protein
VATTKKIIWALDPFDERKRIGSDVTGILRHFSKSGYKIIPTYTLVPDQIDRMAYTLDLVSMNKYRAASLKALKKRIQSLKGINLGAPQVLENKKGTRRSSINVIQSFCKKQKAEFIFVSTHAREGVQRFFLGSFAESLILHAKVPLLVAKPGAKTRGKINNILFPTEFSKENKKAYGKILSFSKAMGAKIRLFHQVPNPIDPILTSGAVMFGGGSVYLGAYLKEEADVLKKEANRWIARAQKQGVKADFKILPRGRGVVDSVIKESKSSKSDLIAMSTCTGTVESVVIGSFTRQVVRSSEAPVFVIRV